MGYGFGKMGKQDIDYDHLIGAVDRIELATDRFEILENLSGYLSLFGIEYVTMGLILNPALVSNDVTRLGVSNFPKEFFESWVDNEFIFHDPILTYAVRSKSAFAWKDAYNYADRYGRKVMDRGAETGLHDGYVIPMFAPDQPIGMVSMALREELDDPAMKATIEIPVVHAYKKLVDLLDPKLLPSRAELTPREIDVLHYVAGGKTNWEIGRILGISENTVKKAVQQILLKYNTSSRTHAVVLAVRQGLILP